MAYIACGGDGAKALPLRGSQDAVVDFTLDLVAEKRDILGSFEKVDEPGAGVDQARGSLTDSKPTRLSRSFGFGKIFPAYHLAHSVHVKAQKHREQRSLLRGFSDLTFGGNIDR